MFLKDLVLNLFTSKHQKILGIDISTTSIKLIELSTSGDELTVEAFGVLSLPENAVEGNILKDKHVIANTIRRLLQTTRVSTKLVALAVPDSSAISRTIQVNEGLSDEDIEELVVIEADKHIPFPIDEINIDFDVLGPNVKNSAKLDVLMVASRTENVNDRLEVMKLAGLEAAVIDVESFAIERALKLTSATLPAAGVNKVIAMIDVGAMYTNLYVLHNLQMTFTREEEFGGHQLIKAIMEQYGMSHDEARIALDNKTLPEDFEELVLQPYKESFLLQVKRGLQFFFSTSRHTYVDHILLTGGVAKLDGLAELVQQHVNIPATIANPFASLRISPTIDEERLLLDAPKLLVACGLAMRTT